MNASLRTVSGMTTPVRAPRATLASCQARPDTAALAVMTDFNRTVPLTVAPEQQVDAALQDMIVGGVRALLVVEDGRLLGLVTANDLQGERPIQFQQSGFCDAYPCRHSDVHVGDVMTPLAKLTLLDQGAAERSTVSDILTLMQLEGLTHLLVMQPDALGGREVHGLFSRTQLERALGDTAATFLQRRAG